MGRYASKETSVNLGSDRCGHYMKCDEGFIGASTPIKKETHLRKTTFTGMFIAT